mmetsp:Transcript_22833/g.70802  ORF Transcript_22833/g.70802 Transcript_22833/m.70802 type:complete len:270 (+) Transcript_22833:42-851(+)
MSCSCRSTSFHSSMVYVGQKWCGSTTTCRSGCRMKRARSALTCRPRRMRMRRRKHVSGDSVIPQSSKTLNLTALDSVAVVTSSSRRGCSSRYLTGSTRSLLPMATFWKSSRVLFKTPKRPRRVRMILCGISSCGSDRSHEATSSAAFSFPSLLRRACPCSALLWITESSICPDLGFRMTSAPFLLAATRLPVVVDCDATELTVLSSTNHVVCAPKSSAQFWVDRCCSVGSDLYSCSSFWMRWRSTCSVGSKRITLASVRCMKGLSSGIQ